jgi:hypothetical protein
MPWVRIALLWLMGAAQIAAAEDVSAAEHGWNGLFQLTALARVAGANTHSPKRLDVSLLTAQDALILVHPEGALPVLELAAFLRKGGRLAIADDFGRGDKLFEAFSIGRRQPHAVDRSRFLRGNPNLIVANGAPAHPLAQGVHGLVTNHPAVLFHAALAPVFALGDPSNAVVLSGAVGAGRLVAISDCSVLINNMLEFDGNRRFAQNLIHYLSADRTGTLYVVGTDVELFGPSTSGDRSQESVNAALIRMEQVKLPRGAILALSLALTLLLLAFAASGLPRRNAYKRQFETPECVAGFAGRVGQHVAGHANFAAPALALKAELETQLRAKLRQHEPPSVNQAPGTLQAAGVPGTVVAETRALLAELDALQNHAPGAALRVSERQFVRIMASGRRILARINAATPTLS